MWRLWRCRSIRPQFVLTPLDEVSEQIGSGAIPLTQHCLGRGARRRRVTRAIRGHADGAGNPFPPAFAACALTRNLAYEAMFFELAKVITGRAARLP